MARASTSSDSEDDTRSLQVERYEVLIKEGAVVSPPDARGDEAPTTLRQNAALLERLRLLAMSNDEHSAAIRTPSDEEAPPSAQPLLLQRPISSRSRLETSGDTLESAHAVQEPNLRDPSSQEAGRPSTLTRVEPSSRSSRPRTRRWESDLAAPRSSSLAPSRRWRTIGQRLFGILARLFRRSSGGGSV